MPLGTYDYRLQSGYSPQQQQAGYTMNVPGGATGQVSVGGQQQQSSPQASQLSAGEMSNLSTYGTTTPSWAKRVSYNIKRIVPTISKIQALATRQTVTIPRGLTKFVSKARSQYTTPTTKSLDLVQRMIKRD